MRDVRTDIYVNRTILLDMDDCLERKRICRLHAVEFVPVIARGLDKRIMRTQFHLAQRERAVVAVNATRKHLARLREGLGIEFVKRNRCSLYKRALFHHAIDARGNLIRIVGSPGEHVAARRKAKRGKR